MLLQTKKAMSVMIGYVLLITFVIILGVIVYQWMRTYVPQDEINCPDGVSIFIQDYECTSTQLTLELKNNGKFNIGGYFIYATNSPEQELATIDLSRNHSIETSKLSPTGIRFGEIVGESNSLTPNKIETEIFDLSGFSGTIYLIEIVPIRWQVEKNRNRLVSCKDAKIKETINCGVGCTPNCAGKECGNDDCGKTCPPGCSGEDVCNAAGQCVLPEECTDTCESLEYVCGTWFICEKETTCLPGCSGDNVCNATGQCIACTPDCGTRNCGPSLNGCGDENACGTCDGLCQEGICSSCNGVWSPPESSGVECDGSPLPENCFSNCTCYDGYDPDESGGCKIPDSVDGCNDYCVWLGDYSDGVCRQNTAQCTVNGETYESGGDVYCIAGTVGDTCCCIL